MRRILVIFPRSILAILLLALVLRLPHLSTSLWLDEAAQALESARPLSQQLDIRDDFQPPLLHLITYVSIRISTAEWWLRLWGALVPGLITVLATYHIGKKLYNERVGQGAALLLATSSFHIFFSQELRPYSLPAMWAVLSLYALLCWVQGKNDIKNWRILAAFAVCTVAGLYSSYLYPFLLIGQAVWILVAAPKKLFAFLGAATAACVSFLPWLPMFFSQLSAGTQVRSDLPGWEAVVSIPQLKSLPLVIAKFLFGVINVAVTPPFLLFTAAIVAIMAVLSWQQRHKLLSQLKFGFIWLLIPLLFAWVTSFWVPVVQPKRVLFLLPGFYILIAGLGLVAIKNNKSLSRLLGYTLLLLVLGANVYGAGRYYLDPTLQRENWQDLHQQITTQYPAEKSIAVFSFPTPFAPWTWYDDGTYPTLATGALTTAAVLDLPNMLKSVSEKEFVLVFDYLRDLTDPENEIPRVLESLGYSQRHIIDYPNIGFVRVFTNNETVLSAQY